MRKSKILLLLLVTLVFSGCAGKNDLYFTGTIQGEERVLSSKINSECKEVYVKEGDEVKVGEKLLLLDDEELKLQVKSGEANLELSRAQLKEAVNGTRSEELKKAVAQVEQIDYQKKALEVESKQKEKSIKRQEELFKNGALSKESYEQAVTGYEVLNNNIKALEKQKESLENQVTLLEKGARKEAIERLQSQVKSAEANLELANYRLGYTIIESSISGRVNSVNIKNDENVSIGMPLISILDPEDLWIRVYIPEDNLGKISLGEKVKIKIDSFKEKEFLGEVTYIADKAQFTPRNVQTKDQRTTTVFPVKVKILTGMDVLKIGLPADVYFPSLGDE